ncbi:MAG: glycosyltransferase family 4 protein [Anaerolineae bacterium]|nr:glycosyltransferase family 4 protein [Anaerolineae bacterium]
MRICVDVSAAVHHRAGLGRYAHELTAALLDVDAGDEYVVFYNRPARAQVAPPLDRLRHLTTNLPNKPWRLSALFAHFAGLPQDRLFPGIDLFHAADHLLPRFSRARSVFTLHDLAFRFYPETHTALNRWFLNVMMPRFLRSADAVIAVSEHTKRDAVRAYEIDEAKVRVIYEGVHPRFRPADPEAMEAVRRKYGLPDRFILSVGTIEPRKNLDTLLAAYRLLRGQGTAHKLVVVGKKGWLYEGFFRRLRELGLEGEVIFPGFIPDNDLPAFYSSAELFAFPSLYEGFGLPPLEAMACGAPVVCADSSSLPEVVGDAALLLPPLDVVAWAEAMRRLACDADLRATLRARGPARARRFSWERAARETVEVYRRVMAR